MGRPIGKRNAALKPPATPAAPSNAGPAALLRTISVIASRSRTSSGGSIGTPDREARGPTGCDRHYRNSGASETRHCWHMISPKDAVVNVGSASARAVSHRMWARRRRLPLLASLANSRTLRRAVAAIALVERGTRLRRPERSVAPRVEPSRSRRRPLAGASRLQTKGAHSVALGAPRTRNQVPRESRRQPSGAGQGTLGSSVADAWASPPVVHRSPDDPRPWLSRPHPALRLRTRRADRSASGGRLSGGPAPAPAPASTPAGRSPSGIQPGWKHP